MRLHTKTVVFTSALMISLLILLTSVSLFVLRHFSMEAARSQTEIAGQIVLTHLTDSMQQGTIADRAQLLERLTMIEGLSEIRLIRGDLVKAQYGEGLASESAQDAIEENVLKTGEPQLTVNYDGTTPYFRQTLPYLANNISGVNCQECHQVNLGDVMGAITITMPMPELKEGAFYTVISLVLTISVFTLLVLFFLRRFTRPIVYTARETHHAVEKAIKGEFNASVKQCTNDEIGQIAKDFNTLSKFLKRDLSEIRDNITRLLRCEESDGSNLLSSTTEMVDGLIDVSQFKQTIEGDERRLEVYQRLARVISDDFFIRYFSIYEVDQEKNKIIPIHVDGEANSDAKWCDPQILIRSEACRVCRTGQIVDSSDDLHICPCFRSAETGVEQYLCIPVIQSGRVGSIIQLAYAYDDHKTIQESRPLLQAYIRETAPVLEAKRLMDALKESALRDAMTGLHNRRFLEEYMETLTAGATRRQTSLAVLMMDVDYFKKVNDTYGHAAGDKMLKSLGSILTNSVRTSDLVIRYGGEEFLVLLQDSSAENAFTVAEKIRLAVENYKFQIPGAILNKTISIGVANFPDDADTLWQTIKFADVALYKAKDSGRNKVIAFAPEMWEGHEEYVAESLKG